MTDLESEGRGGRNVAAALLASGVGACSGYLLLGWGLKRAVDLPGVSAALVSAACVMALVGLTAKLERARVAAPVAIGILCALPPLTGLLLVAIDSAGVEETGDSWAAQAFGPAVAGVARNALGLTGVALGCLLAGLVVGFASYRSRGAETSAGSRVLASWTTSARWIVCSASGAVPFFYLLF